MVEHTDRENGRVRIDALRRAAPVHQSAGLRKPRPTKSCCAPARAWTTAASPCWPRSAARASRSTAGRRSPSSPPAMKSWKSPRRPRSSRFAIPTPTRWRRRWRAPAASRRSCRWRATTVEHTREIVERGLAADLLLLSGGVSAGKYDVVEPVARRPGRGVLLRPRAHPARPAAGFRPRAREVLFRPAGQPFLHHGDIRDLRARRAGTARRPGGSCAPHALRAAHARVPSSGRADALPARAVERRWRGSRRRSQWHGSGDIPALTRANAFLVADPDRAEYSRGELIRVLLK